jgi:nitronate monooxygenase
MNMWPDRRVLELFGIELPIIQAPMAGANLSELAIAVSEAGGLGSLPCALLSLEQARSELEGIRAQTKRPLNVNFFCHETPQVDAACESRWRQRLQRYYVELGIDPYERAAARSRAPFDEKFCDLVVEFRPEVVSFHFGFPEQKLLERVRDAGAKIISSATSVHEARWLEDRGCDAVIAQGFEAGGHQGNFLSEDISTQIGTNALVPLVADAVKVPVIASGGIADARGIAAAFALGASAVQLGTAYLYCPEAKISSVYREALGRARVEDNRTAMTNLFSGRPARGIMNRLMKEQGAMSDDVPHFPLASAALAPLRAKAEKVGSGDFSPLWSGQAAPLARELPAGELTKRLAAETLERLQALVAEPNRSQ